MAYDLIIRGGKIVDGSGMPGFLGDIGVQDGRIVTIGKLSGGARRVLDADGLAVAPGVIDSHCHYDAQVTWDPLCTYSCYHGVTTVVNGNCSLGLAPARQGDREALASVLANVEAIPIEALAAGTAWSWETIPQYLDALDRRLGINVASLIGYSAVRRYVMGEAAHDREATEEEIAAMKAIVREGMQAGSLGISFERNPRHFDLQGKLSPCNLASDQELREIAGVLRELGTGIIQAGGAGMGMMLAEASGRPVQSGGVGWLAIDPDGWKKRLARVEEVQRQGFRIYSSVNSVPQEDQFTLKTAQHFDMMPTWRSVMYLPMEERKRAFQDPATRAKLHFEAVETPPDPSRGGDFTRRWDLCSVDKPALAKNASLKGKSITQLAHEQGKDVLDAFLDLALEEDLETVFERRERNSDEAVMATLLTSPYLYHGGSDGGGHVVTHIGYQYPTYFLGHWVREKGIMSLEEGVRKLTSIPASIFGLHDRGLLQPGLVADLMVFDPETIGPLEAEYASDLPTGALRRKQLAQGIEWTVVNGEVLLERGSHTGACPGRVFRNSVAAV